MLFTDQLAPVVMALSWSGVALAVGFPAGPVGFLAAGALAAGEGVDSSSFGGVSHFSAEPTRVPALLGSVGVTPLFAFTGGSATRTLLLHRAMFGGAGLTTGADRGAAGAF